MDQTAHGAKPGLKMMHAHLFISRSKIPALIDCSKYADHGASAIGSVTTMDIDWLVGWIVDKRQKFFYFGFAGAAVAQGQMIIGKSKSPGLGLSFVTPGPDRRKSITALIPISARWSRAFGVGAAPRQRSRETNSKLGMPVSVSRPS